MPPVVPLYMTFWTVQYCYTGSVVQYLSSHRKIPYVSSTDRFNQFFKFIYRSICISVVLSVFLSFYLYFCRSICISVVLSVFLSLYLYFCRSICISVVLSKINKSIKQCNALCFKFSPGEEGRFFLIKNSLLNISGGIQASQEVDGH